MTRRSDQPVIRLALLSVTAALVLPAAVLLVADTAPAEWGAPGAPLAWGIAFAVIGYVVDRSRPANPIGRLLQVAGIGSAALETLYRIGVMLGESRASEVVRVATLAPSWMWMIPIAALFHSLAVFSGRGAALATVANSGGGFVDRRRSVVRRLLFRALRCRGCHQSS